MSWGKPRKKQKERQTEAEKNRDKDKRGKHIQQVPVSFTPLSLLDAENIDNMTSDTLLIGSELRAKRQRHRFNQHIVVFRSQKILPKKDWISEPDISEIENGKLHDEHLRMFINRVLDDLIANPEYTIPRVKPKISKTSIISGAALRFGPAVYYLDNFTFQGLKELREQYGYRQYEVADVLGISTGLMSHIESDRKGLGDIKPGLKNDLGELYLSKEDMDKHSSVIINNRLSSMHCYSPVGFGALRFKKGYSASDLAERIDLARGSETTIIRMEQHKIESHKKHYDKLKKELLDKP